VPRAYEGMEGRKKKKKKMTKYKKNNTNKIQYLKKYSSFQKPKFHL
jgi:hypothetical protein